MHEVKDVERVPYTVRQMFGLFADVEHYKEFLPWCRDSRILHREKKNSLCLPVCSSTRLRLPIPGDRNPYCRDIHTQREDRRMRGSHRVPGAVRIRVAPRIWGSHRIKGAARAHGTSLRDFSKIDQKR